MPDQSLRPILRKQLRRLRRNIAVGQRKQFDQAIQHHLLVLIESMDINSMAAYWPFDGEPDILSLCRNLRERGMRIALPRIASSENLMTFHSWCKDVPLQDNPMGIPEPIQTEQLSVADMDLIIIPLVGYDHSGNRLGVGGGYYDRHLESFRDSHIPLRVGIAYSQQHIESLQAQEWDIPLHAVINENGKLTFMT